MNFPTDADEIMARVLADCADFPDELPAIKAGTPRINVKCSADWGTGWTCSALITSGVGTAEGEYYPIDDPANWIRVPFRRRDGRLSAATNAKRLLASRFAGVNVPIVWEDR